MSPQHKVGVFQAQEVDELVQVALAPRFIYPQTQLFIYHTHDDVSLTIILNFSESFT